MVVDEMTDMDSDSGKLGISLSQMVVSTMDRIKSGLLQPPSGGGTNGTISHFLKAPRSRRFAFTQAVAYNWAPTLSM
jgi:hypothetical protein